MSQLIIISILPIIVLLFYIYRKDKNEREPIGLLAKTFFGGIASAVLILLVGITLELIGIDLDINNYPVLTNAFLHAAIPEECMKFLFLYWIVWKNPEFNEHFDGIVYAVFVSMGFACLENILYVLSSGIGVGIARAIFSVPAHFLFAVLMGYYFARAHFTASKRGRFLFLTLLIPILAHGIFDAIIFSIDTINTISSSLSTILATIFLIFDIRLWHLALKKIRCYCHICGRKIPKNMINCQYCMQAIEEYNQKQQHPENM